MEKLASICDAADGINFAKETNALFFRRTLHANEDVQLVNEKNDQVGMQRAPPIRDKESIGKNKSLALRPAVGTAFVWTKGIDVSSSLPLLQGEGRDRLIGRGIAYAPHDAAIAAPRSRPRKIREAAQPSSKRIGEVPGRRKLAGLQPELPLKLRKAVRVKACARNLIERARHPA